MYKIKLFSQKVLYDITYAPGEYFSAAMKYVRKTAGVKIKKSHFEICQFAVNCGGKAGPRVDDRPFCSSRFPTPSSCSPPTTFPLPGRRSSEIPIPVQKKKSSTPPRSAGSTRTASSSPRQRWGKLLGPSNVVEKLFIFFRNF